MVAIRISIPPEIQTEMEKYPRIDWSKVVAKAIQKKLDATISFNEIKKSRKDRKF